MGFTTKMALAKDKPELYPGKIVLVQHSYDKSVKKANTYFSLNKDAMLAFGMTPYIPNVNNITWGIDDETKDLMLAAMEGDAKTSKITAENKFSNLSFMDKLVKQFEIDPVVEHVFELGVYEENGIFVAGINLMVGGTEVIHDTPYERFEEELDKVVEEKPAESFDTMINNLHADSKEVVF